ncbi:uncharacterized protein [Primulina huaijiensis]|uniref:uncharacterized protein isoform X1 n=1 Tax=Primulina huaijiensis TaxID=1492673 RepID=UPI003CC79314
METCLSAENVGQLNPKEEVFCSTLTLPTGDTPDDLQDNIISGFVGIFSRARDEGKISRKLVECINTYLLEDRPNIGGKSLEIHQAVNHFVFRKTFAILLICPSSIGFSYLLWEVARICLGSLLMFFTAPGVKSPLKSAFPLNEVGNGWHVIRNRLMQSLPTVCNVTSIVSILFSSTTQHRMTQDFCHRSMMLSLWRNWPRSICMLAINSKRSAA